jgi:hypothetical protein
MSTRARPRSSSLCLTLALSSLPVCCCCCCPALPCPALPARLLLIPLGRHQLLGLPQLGGPLVLEVLEAGSSAWWCCRCYTLAILQGGAVQSSSEEQLAGGGRGEATVLAGRGTHMVQRMPAHCHSSSSTYSTSATYALHNLAACSRGARHQQQATQHTLSSAAGHTAHLVIAAAIHGPALDARPHLCCRQRP